MYTVTVLQFSVSIQIRLICKVHIHEYTCMGAEPEKAGTQLVTGSTDGILMKWNVRTQLKREHKRVYSSDTRCDQATKSHWAATRAVFKGLDCSPAREPEMVIQDAQVRVHQFIPDIYCNLGRLCMYTVTVLQFSVSSRYG
jgi:hypothetical protein